MWILIPIILAFFFALTMVVWTHWRVGEIEKMTQERTERAIEEAKVIGASLGEPVSESGTKFGQSERKDNGGN